MRRVSGGPLDARNLGRLQIWEDHAACKGKDPALFHPPDESVDQFVYSQAAKEICCDCPVIWECLKYSVLNREPDGIWGGAAPYVRDHIYRRFLRDGELGLQAGMGEAIEHLGRTVAGLPDERPVTPAHDCGRCGEPVDAAVLPVDRNGPGATCGIVATYNKGCRCRPCKDAKSRHFYSQSS